MATSVVLAISSLNGLEASLSAWLIVLLVRSLARGRGTQWPSRTGAVAFAAVLTRPDSLLIVGALAATALLLEKTQPMLRRALWALGAIAAELLVLAFSVLYYSDPLPNTFYAKNGLVERSLASSRRPRHLSSKNPGG